tara:strand:+ start:3100 stop:3510 length:411 start_codon:yes stop_codon:yes gene_type:complete
MCDVGGKQMVIPRRKPSASEINFFNKQQIPGYAAEDNHVVVSPNPQTGVNIDAVANNEAMRVYLRNKKFTEGDLPPLTETQVLNLKNNSYGAAPMLDRKSTTIARLFSGDPSAGTASPLQQNFLNQHKDNFRLGEY